MLTYKVNTNKYDFVTEKNYLNDNLNIKFYQTSFNELN